MRFRFSFFLILFPLLGFSQSVTVGAGTFGGSNVYGPMYSTNNFDTAFSRQAYIYPATVLTGLMHGDTISSLEFYAQADLPMTGNPNLKIYLKMVKNDTFPAGNIHWTKESTSTGMVLVYDANPISIMDGNTGFKNFIFNINKFKFDTIGKKLNLEILFSYSQSVKQQSNTFWLYESNASVTAFKSRNEGKIAYGIGKSQDSTRASDVRKPFVKINFPRYKNNLEVAMTYCLGKVPLLAGVKDSVKILIANKGKNSVSGSKLYLKIAGANKHRDSLVMGKINPWEEKLFTFGKYKPDSIGTDTLYTILANDEFNGNNFDTIFRLIGHNVYSHADPFMGNSGGVGFTGSTGDFVAKFFSDTGVFINQVSVDFSSSGRGFRVGIWDDKGSGGFPGNVLFMSDSLISKGGTYILPILPRVKVGGGFFVGIRQNTTTNVAFSFQDEDPIRPGAFYFTAPMGNTTWTPFSPGFPFKINIEPRIQVGNDVSPITILFPTSNQDIEYSIKDSLGPIATIFNYGSNNQTTPFDVECIISNAFGFQEYKSTKQLTLNSGQSKNVYFDTAYRIYNLGNHKISVTTKLKNDKVIDNNTLEHQFKISIKNDIGVDIMYAPSDAAIYEYKRDTITPTVRLNNYGTIAKNNFKVTFQIRNDTSIIHTETLTKSLGASSQQIISFSKYVPKHIGDYIAECFTSLKDSIPYNDTIRHNITLQKSNDVAPKKIDIPLPSNIYTMGGFFLPRLTVINHGLKTQDTAFKVELRAYAPSGKLFHYDSIFTPLGGYSETQIAYKKLTIPLTFGKYKVVFKTLLKGDQEPSNDTLTGFFNVIPNRDIGVTKILFPAHDTLLDISEIPFNPIISIKNYGSQTLTSAGPMILKIFQKNVLVYQDSTLASGNLSYNSKANITFNKPFTLNSLGDFTAKFYSSLSGDLIAGNDTLTSRFKITRKYDLAIDTISNFTNGQSFIYENNYFLPQILVQNFGSTSYPEAYNVKLELYKDGILKKSTIRTFDSLAKFATFSFFQDSLIHLRQVGSYKLCVKVDGDIDLNHSNDSFCWTFNIIKPNDLALDSLVLPDKTNQCYQNIVYKPRLKATNFGTTPIVNTFIQFRIYKTATVYWENSKQINLNPAESKWISFDSTLSFNFLGTAWARAVGSLFMDNEKNNDTLIKVFEIAFESGIQSFPKSIISVSPNPTEDKLVIKTIENIDQMISIYNSSGQIIFSNKLSPKNKTLELNLKTDLNLSKGMYFFRLSYLKDRSIHYQSFNILLN